MTFFLQMLIEREHLKYRERKSEKKKETNLKHSRFISREVAMTISTLLKIKFDNVAMNVRAYIH